MLHIIRVPSLIQRAFAMLGIGYGVGVTETTPTITLQALNVIWTPLVQGTPSSGAITGATTGSTIAASGLPAGLTINSAARTWAWDGTGAAGSGTATLTETLAGAANSPKITTISWIINSNFGFGGSGTLSAPTLDFPSPVASNPTSLGVHVPADWQSGDVLKIAYSATAAISSPTIISHTLTDADIAAGTASVSLPTLSSQTYFQALGHDTADSANLSNIVAWGDTTAPTITTPATQSITETSPLAIALTVTDAGGVPAQLGDGTASGWAIVGGNDQLQFQIAIVSGVATLQWYNNGYQNYASPKNSPANAANPYVVIVRAVDYSGNHTDLTINVTVTQIDQTPDNFTFTNVTNAPLSTVETSNTVTISGLQPGFSIPASLSDPGSVGFAYSKNGGSYTGAGNFSVQNGDTLTLRVTSGAANSIAENCQVTVGTYTTGWTVQTPGSAATNTTGTGSTGAGTNRSKYVNATAFQVVSNNNVGAACCDRADMPASNAKFHIEWTLNSFKGSGGGSGLYLGFDDGTTALNGSGGGGFIASSAYPGASGAGAGIFIAGIVKGQNTPTLYYNGGSHSVTFPAAFTDGQIISADVDTTTNTIIISQLHSGTTSVVSTITLTSQIPSSWNAIQGGAQGNGTAGTGTSDSVNTNYGASSWAITPQPGFGYYA